MAVGEDRKEPSQSICYCIIYTLGEFIRKSLKILANFLPLMAILQDWGPKFKSCKIFQKYANFTRYLTRFVKEKLFAANILQDL